MNKLESLSREDVREVETLLQTLDVSRGQLQQIQPGTFGGMEQLVMLDLSQTNIESINRDTFSGLENLRNLNLSFTSLKVLSDNTFIDLVSLVTLDLRGDDELTRISNNAFNGIGRLQDLFIGVYL